MDEAEQAYRDIVEFAETLDNPDLVLAAAETANAFARQMQRTDLRLWLLRKILTADPSQIRVWDEFARLSEGKNRGSGPGVWAKPWARISRSIPPSISMPSPNPWRSPAINRSSACPMTAST